MRDKSPGTPPIRAQYSEANGLFEDNREDSVTCHLNNFDISTGPLDDQDGSSSVFAGVPRDNDIDTHPEPAIEVDLKITGHDKEKELGIKQSVEYSEPEKSQADAQNDDDHESSSLFIPERHPDPRPITRPPVPQAPTTARTSKPVNQLSVFARMREMQKQNKQRKVAYANLAPASQVNEHLNPDNVDPEDTAHREACAEFQRQEEYYKEIKKQHKGHLPFRQDIEWMRIKGTEDARLRKRKRDLITAQEGEEIDLFPRLRSHYEDQGDESDNGSYAEGSQYKRRRGDQPRKQSKPVSLQQAELQAMRVAIDASNDLAKKKNQKSTVGEQLPATSTKSKTPRTKTTRQSRTKKAAISSGKTPRTPAKDRRELERAKKQAVSLFNSNVFDQQAATGAADQPVFQSRNKRDALKELIASVPLPEKLDARNDMNALLQASKDFDGHGACRIAENSNWRVRGMATNLKGYQVLGSAFMRRRENGVSEPRGGLVADQMGLGKTLMMLGELWYHAHPRVLTEDSKHR